jgi:hypothetical protein
LNFCIESVDSGTLSLNGQTVQPGVTQLPPGQSLTWTRSASGSGQVNAFHVSVWENDQQLGSSVGVDLSFSSPNSLTAAVNDSATVAENAPATAIDVLANDTGLGTLSVLQVGAAQHGYVTLQNGQVLYQPDPDYSGPDGFSYTMADESNTTSLASVVVTVTAVPQNPQTIFHLFQVTTGTTALLDVSQGDYDPDGTAVTLTAVAAAQHGSRHRLRNGCPDTRFQQSQYLVEHCLRNCLGCVLRHYLRRHIDSAQHRSRGCHAQWRYARRRNRFSRRLLDLVQH